jgi:hypothetical protein
MNSDEYCEECERRWTHLVAIPDDYCDRAFCREHAEAWLAENDPESSLEVLVRDLWGSFS